MKCLLFVYGLLKPGYQPPETMTRHWPDRVAGRLYDLGPYPGAVALGAADSWIDGEVLDIDDVELEALDRFERVGQGLYARRRVATAAGHEVWIYEYTGVLPACAKPIRVWHAGSGA